MSRELTERSEIDSDKSDSCALKGVIARLLEKILFPFSSHLELMSDFDFRFGESLVTITLFYAVL